MDVIRSTMTTRISFALLLSLLFCSETGSSQDVPPPPPTPDVAPLSQPPGNAAPTTVAPSQPSQYSPPSGYSPQPGAYQPYVPGAPPPGAVMVVPSQPYAYPAYPAYPPPGPYAQPVVIVPAPPLSSYQWFAGIDAMFLERSSGGSIPLGYTVYNPAPGLPPAEPIDNLYSDDATFPLAAGVRLEIGRKLTDNITLEATYWGLQQWSVGNSLYGDPNNYTVLAFSPYLQLPTLLNGLDDTLGYSYESQVENVELNVSFRLNSDNPYWRLDWLWGARFINLSDQFTLTGSDIANSASENFASSTSNNLIGVQTGLLFVHGWERFQWETGVKAGLMVNIFRQHVTDTAADPLGVPGGFVPFDVSNDGSAVSGVFEVTVGARIRLTDLLWLRLGYDFYDITSLALGPRQLSSFGHGGNVALDGLSVGLQATW